MVQKFTGISLKNKIIMGVLNLSPETFYKGSLAKNVGEATARAEKMVENGGQIIDLGAMSTGPNVEPISKEREREILLPTLKAVREKIETPISIDTQRAGVAEESLEAGGNMINDVSGFKADSEMPRVVSDHECPAILMANRISGRVRTAEKGGKDIETMGEIKEGLKESLKICDNYGIERSKIAIDPAIGFGRSRSQDLKVIAELEDLLELNQPICVGVSRKSSIGRPLGLQKPSDRLYASLGATAVAVMKGADIVRTHDPKETSHLIRIIEAIQQAGKDG